MILKITQQAARLLAPQDANRAMHQSGYNDAPNKSTANGASRRPAGHCCFPKETVLRSRRGQLPNRLFFLPKDSPHYASYRIRSALY